MDHPIRLGGLDTIDTTQSVSRNMSSVSDRQFFPAKSVLSPPPDVNPQPAYISVSAASQWVSAELGDEEITVSPTALVLLNSFLDQMLFSFLSSARSTRLPQLRVAVPEVLKPRLGNQAMASADEELSEYLGEGDDDEVLGIHGGHEVSGDFDLELAWKLARLRCMVYTRLGDIEEEDALEIIEREQLDEQGLRHRRFSSRSTNITPAGAIFLTSIIEYLGEQALYHAGLLAQTRISGIQSQVHDSTHKGSSDSRGIRVLEGIDMRRLGREGPLARIWRNWRRPLKSPQGSLSGPFSPASPSHEDSGRSGSGAAVETIPHPNTAETAQLSDATQIPLPTSENDVNEIEVPGLAHDFEDAAPVQSEEALVGRQARRSNSVSIYANPVEQPSTPSPTHVQTVLSQRDLDRPSYNRTRSRSLPTPPQTPLAMLRDPRKNNVVDVPATDRNELRNAATVDAANEEGVSTAATESQDQGHARSPKRNGVVMEAVSRLVGAATVSGPSFASNESRKGEAEPGPSARGTIADRMLGSNGPSMEDRAPPSTMTGASIHNVLDFESMHLPERKRGFSQDGTSLRGLDTDPEDLALSSADEESRLSESRPLSSVSKLSQRRSKQGSVTPIQVEDLPGPHFPQSAENYVPTPVYSDFPQAPTKHDSFVTLTPPQEPSVSNHEIHQITPLSTSPTSNSAFNALDSEVMNPTASAAKTTQIAGLSKLDRNSSSSQGYSKNPESRSSVYSERSSASSKLLQFTRDEQGRPLSSALHEQVSIPRTMSPPSSRVVNGMPNSQPGSTIIHEEPRPTTAVSLKSAKQSTLRPGTSSGDSRETERANGAESEAKKKSLEILIRGDETLHYTLTPESARAIKFPDNEKLTLATTRDSAESSKAPPATSQQSAQHRTRKSGSSVRTNTGLRSHPVNEEGESSTTVPVRVPPTTTSRPTTGHSVAIPPKFRRRVEPRDAKVDRSTSRDLADYLRSTGPESDRQLPRALSSRPGTSTTNGPATPRNAAQYLQEVENSRSGAKVGARSPMTPSGGSVTSSRSFASRYTPRDAKVPRSTTTSALADFIREGPPRAAGEHRIPRTVAPFRTTMDSDDLNGLAPSTDKDKPERDSAASTYDSSTVESSATSHTALLNGSKRTAATQVNGAKSGGLVDRKLAAPAVQDAMPVRKQRRVRDPYAIDDSDDDMSEVVAPKSRREEESLIDFLRNTAPQPNNAPQPVMTSSPAAPSSPNLQKKSSSSGIKERLTLMSGLNRKSSKSNLQTSSRSEHPPAYSRGSTTRSESPHLSQVGSKLDSYKPTQPTHAGYVDRVRQSRNNGAVSSAGQPQSIDDNRSGSNHHGLVTKDESGFMAFFARRKSVKKQRNA